MKNRDVILKNIAYDSQTNTTSIYGHTNFQELKINGNSVALASQIPDITQTKDSHIAAVSLFYSRFSFQNSLQTGI